MDGLFTYMNNHEDSPLTYLIKSKAFPFLSQLILANVRTSLSKAGINKGLGVL